MPATIAIIVFAFFTYVPVFALLSLSGRLGWRHAFDLDPARSRVSFAGGDAFTVTGAPIAEDALVVDAGAEFTFGRGARLSVGYSGQMGDGVRDHGARAMLRVPF